ncbi:MAG: phosphodiester glycosidase family protein [Clostridia bacterium]|nr:phosphodiester glycosidase family protein [Clostridia bacterium]
MKKLLKIILRSLCVVLITLIMILLFLLGGMWIIAKGPSPAAGRLFALSVRETSAVGFLANIYFSEEELAAFYNNVEIDDKTDSSLIQIPDKNPGDDVPDDGGELPPGYEGPQGTPSPEEDNNGIEVVDVKGGSYLGKMMIVKDPSRLVVGTPDSFGENSKGLSVYRMIEKYGAVAGINAGGFADEGGSGTGGIPDGIVIVDGKVLWDHGNNGTAYNVVGFDKNNILHVGRMTAAQAVSEGITDAVSFGPSLIINGKPANSSRSLGGGLNPRTAIGQRSDGAVLLLVINGRQIDSLGATYDDLIDIMLEFGAVNASNLDGGSSSLMIYNGEYLNNSAYIFGERVIATSFLVMPEVSE